MSCSLKINVVPFTMRFYLLCFFSLFSQMSPYFCGDLSLYILIRCISALHLYDSGKPFGCFSHQNPSGGGRESLSYEVTIQVSFPHKCGQFSWCNALNVKVAVTFPDISFFRYLHDFVVFLEALLSDAGSYLKYFRDAFAPQDPRSVDQFTLSPQTSYPRDGFWITYMQLFIYPRIGPMAQKCARIIYSHNSPSKLHSFLFQERWDFDYIQESSHVLVVFTRGGVFSLALRTSLTLRHSQHSIYCLVQCYLPHILRCNEDPMVEIFYGVSSGNFPAHLFSLYKRYEGDHFSHFSEPLVFQRSSPRCLTLQLCKCRLVFTQLLEFFLFFPFFHYLSQ